MDIMEESFIESSEPSFNSFINICEKLSCASISVFKAWRTLSFEGLMVVVVA